MTITLVGKCSWFGGPDDHGVKPDEGLALWEQKDLSRWEFMTGTWFENPHGIFLQYRPQGTSGMARRLDPKSYYIATRWDYEKTPREFLRKNHVTVFANKTQRSFQAWPADWGPNENTGRVADLSPQLLKHLGIETDDVVTVTIPEPKSKLPLGPQYNNGPDA